MRSTPSKNNSKDRLLPVTNRAATDSSGDLGALYDGYRDRLLGQINVNNKGKTSHVFKSRTCLITNGNNDQNENILKMIGVEDDLRVSLLLNLAKKTGIGAFIGYQHSINEYTRFFFYSYSDRDEQLSDDPVQIRSFDKSSNYQTSATHIITEIRWGIHVIIVLQLPSNVVECKEIDDALHRMRTVLNNENTALNITSDEKKTLDKSIHIKVYSNMSDLSSSTRMSDICHYLIINKNSTNNRPISYTLRPIKRLSPQYTGEGAVFIALSEELNKKIESYVLQLTNDINKLEASVTEDLPRLLCGHLRERFSIVQKQWLDVKNKHANEIDRLAKLVVAVRCGKIGMSQIEKTLYGTEQKTMEKTIHDLTRSVNNLKEKGHLINSLLRQQFQYANVAERGVDRFDNDINIEFKLFINEQLDRVLCSTDALNTNNPGQLNALRDGLIKELKSNSNLRLIYADFSYCSLELYNMLRLPKSKYDSERNKSKQKETSSYTEIRPSVPISSKVQTYASSFTQAQNSSPTPTRAQMTVPSPKNVSPTVLLSTKPTTTTPPPTKAHPSIPTPIKALPAIPSTLKAPTYAPPSKKTYTHIAPPLSLPTDEIINVLLLGETGVGKSTFINAFANYLTFETIGNAQSGEPVVLIPVSFLITVGDNFDERTVKFGDVDGSNNEDFDHHGQSVTQKCKSYIFALNHSDGKKLRIIDTPGFGDTRGVDQDDRNMKHILEYIKKLPHLNAVCFLLKPNESRLNIFFRSCLTQLLSLLGPNVRNNIIFCFTNARSTFYTPGNTAPLLKSMLASLPAGSISFNKENAFCFDNESFRYLVALKNNISFNDHEKQEYQMSWSTSVRESNRLVRYICEKLTAYRISY